MARIKRKPFWWKTKRAKTLRAKFDKRIKAKCKLIEHRAEYQAACWNYLWKREAKKFLREYDKDTKK